MIKAVLAYYRGDEADIPFNSGEIKSAKKWLIRYEDHNSFTLEKLIMAEKLVSQKSSNNLILF